MKKLLFAAAAMLGIGLFAGTASADGCGTPFCQGSRSQAYPGKFLHGYPAPVVQAAPWYLYFPYNAHFMTPGPLHAPFFAPPYHGGAMINPYFPAPVHIHPHHGHHLHPAPVPVPHPAP